MTNVIRNATVSYMRQLCIQSIRLAQNDEEKTAVDEDNEPLVQKLLSLNAPYLLTEELGSDIFELWWSDVCMTAFNRIFYTNLHFCYSLAFKKRSDYDQNTISMTTPNIFWDEFMPFAAKRMSQRLMIICESEQRRQVIMTQR